MLYSPHSLLQTSLQFPGHLQAHSFSCAVRLQKHVVSTNGVLPDLHLQAQSLHRAQQQAFGADRHILEGPLIPAHGSSPFIDGIIIAIQMNAPKIIMVFIIFRLIYRPFKLYRTLIITQCIHFILYRFAYLQNNLILFLINASTIYSGHYAIALEIYFFN